MSESKENHMGWWRTENGIIGDKPADIMDAAIKAIEKVYLEEAGRQPMVRELSDLIEFCTCGMLRFLCGSRVFTPSMDIPDPNKAAFLGWQGVVYKLPSAMKWQQVDPKTGQMDAPGGDTSEMKERKCSE